MAETQDLSDVQTGPNGAPSAGSRLEPTALADLRALGGLLMRTGAGWSLDARLLLELVAGYEARVPRAPWEPQHLLRLFDRSRPGTDVRVWRCPCGGRYGWPEAEAPDEAAGRWALDHLGHLIEFPAARYLPARVVDLLRRAGGLDDAPCDPMMLAVEARTFLSQEAPEHPAGPPDAPALGPAPDLGSLRERLQSHQTRLVRMRSSLQSDRDLLEDLDETLAWLRRCTVIEPPPGPCPSQQRLLVVGTPVFCGLRAGHAGMHEEAPRPDRPAVAWTETGPELDWACMAPGCKRRGLTPAVREFLGHALDAARLAALTLRDDVAQPDARHDAAGSLEELASRARELLLVGGEAPRPGLRHAWPEAWTVDRLAARGENPGDALELVAEGINERLLAVMDRMPDGRMRTALSECRGFLQAMFVAAEGVKAQGARLEAALAQRADERGSTRWPDVPAHSKALVVEAAAHKVTLAALEGIADKAAWVKEDSDAGEALQAIEDQARRALERGRMARDPDRGDGGTDLQQAMEIYYASGGLPSAIERTESAWFWRRTAKIATERAGMLGRRLDKLENALHFLRRTAAEEADAQRAMTPGMDSDDYAERELSSHRDTLRRLAEHASFASYGNGVRATAVLFQAGGAAAASAWLQSKLGVAAEGSWLAAKSEVTT